ncbi:MAG TPA: hypothetical protein VIS09_04280 [Streptomyces sp.]
MMNNLLRAASAVALTALPLVPAGPADASEASSRAQAGPCASVSAPFGYVCVPAPKQCFTTPCPQYDLVALSPDPRPEGGA